MSDEATTFGIGDPVMFKSGGPTMTITGVYTDQTGGEPTGQVVCGWFIDEQGTQFQERRFDTRTLRKPDSPLAR